MPFHRNFPDFQTFLQISDFFSPSQSHVCIENIQRRFTSRITEYQTLDQSLDRWMCTVSYADRLTDLKVYSLERRRERVMILYAYRIIIGLLDFPWIEPYFERGIRLRPRYVQGAPQRVRKVRHSSFFYKGAQLYNLLPIELRQLETGQVC